MIGTTYIIRKKLEKDFPVHGVAYDIAMLYFGYTVDKL